MRWVLASNHHSTLQEYHLIDNENCKVVVKYNPRHKSARIICGIHQRLFFIETSGSIKPKTIFKNEYGLEIGSLVQDNNKGLVIINEKKYNFLFANNPSVELVIYDKTPNAPLVTCGLKSGNSDTKIFLSDNTRNVEDSCLLLGVCWYLFLPIAKETIVEYAVA